MEGWQLLWEKPRIIVDSARNEAGLKILPEGLANIDYNQLHFVLGTVADKSREKILSFFPKDVCYFFAKADIPRDLDARVLQNEAAAFGLKVRAYVSGKNALRAAKRVVKPNDLIFIGGNIFCGGAGIVVSSTRLT